VPASPPSPRKRARQADITSSSGRCHDRSRFMKSGAERRGVIRNHARAESCWREVSTRQLTQLPRGLRLLLRRPERSRDFRRDDPAKRPGSVKRSGRARESRRRGASGPGKARQTSSIGRLDKPGRPTVKRTQPES